MRKLLTYIFLLCSLSAFAQPTIWGGGKVLIAQGDTSAIQSVGSLRSWIAANLKAFSAVQDAIASVGSGNGTSAGNVATITGAAGGATSANSGTVTGGTGGKIIGTGGNGGAITGTPGTGFGGTGGEISFTAGDGGLGTTFGGTGGNANLQAGIGGNGTTPGSGGYASLKGGNGSASGNSSGGNVFLVGGAKTGSGSDGDIYIGVSPAFSSRGKIKVGGSTPPVALVSVGEEGSKSGTISVAGSTSGTITIQPAAAAGTYTLTLPTSDGSASEVLTTDGSGVLSWAANGAGSVATDAIWDAAGDIVQGTGANTAARLAIGTANQQLRVNAGATALEYFTPSAGSGDVATDAIWDAKGDLAVGTGANTAVRLAVGTDGKQVYADADETAGLRWGPYVITPSQISSDQDNYNPTGWDECQILRLNADAFRAITSIAATFSGDTKTLFNEGAVPIYFPGEHPDGTAANRFLTPRDYIILPGESVDIWYDGTSSRWRFKGYKPDIIDYKGLYYYTSFGSSTAGDWGYLTFFNSGTLASITPTDAGTPLPGYWSSTTGTTSTGTSYMYFPKSATQVSVFADAHLSAQALLSIPTLSDGTNRFYVDLSINDSPTTAATSGAANNNTIGIRYRDDVSANWEGYSRDNSGTETTVNLGVAVSTNTLYNLRVEIDKAKTEVRYYINNSYAGRVTANLPNSNTCGPRIWLQKTLGATARTVNIHKFSFQSVYP